MQRQFPATLRSAAGWPRPPRRSGRARWARCGCWSPSGGAASDPKNAAALDAINTEISKAPDVVSVSTPVFADNNSSALISAILSVDPEDLAARNSIDWMRSHLTALPAAKGARRSTSAARPH